MPLSLKSRSKLILLAATLTAGCKTTKDHPRDDSKTSETGASAQKGDLNNVLSNHQKAQIGQLLDELASHLGKFELQLYLRGTLDNALKSCGNTAAQTSASSLLNATTGIKPCPSLDGGHDAAKKIIASIATMRRSPGFEQRIAEFIDDVLPTVLDAVSKSPRKSMRLDPGQLKQIIEQINEVAMRAQTFASRISWKPSFMAATRYLHQIILTELSKTDPSTVDWDLIRKATNAHLDIFPFSPADASVNPVVVSFKNPLYQTLYGPNPRGAGYWLMLATASLRIPSYTGTQDAVEIPPRELEYLDTIEKQILLESPADQATIKAGLKTLRNNILELIR